MGISENWKKIVIGAVIVFALILVLIGFFLGLQGLGQFFKFVLIGLLICSILFGIGYVIYILFIRKEYKDIPAAYRKKLHMTTKVMENDMLGELYLSGDTKHNRIRMGKYFYLRIKLPKVYEVPSEDGKTKITKTEEMPIEVFIVNRKGWINRLFSDPIFIMCRPEDHDYSAIFNDVTINGFNLVPLDSQFYTIDRRNLDIDVIKGLALNYIREVVYDIFKDLSRLVSQSMALDSTFQKDKEKAREFEIPQIPQIQQK